MPGRGSRRLLAAVLLGLGIEWLGIRDSNPDLRNQNPLSYH